MNSSEMAKKSWAAKIKKYGKAGVRKQMSENGKKGAAKRWGVDNLKKDA